MKITIAQLNPTVGHIEGNLAKLMEALDSCRDNATDLLVAPELFLVGYPPRDLLEKPWFIEQTQQAIDTLVEKSKHYPDIGILLGAPMPTNSETGKGIYNSALLIYQGKILLTQHKSLLPTYDVFDEERYFDRATDICTVNFKGEVLGISICEDAWNDPELWPKGKIYDFDPIEALAQKGATLFINISASPFNMEKEELRYKLICNHAKRYGIPFVYVNQVGGNDELIFDGRSICVDAYGLPIAVCSSFKEHLQTVDTTVQGNAEIYAPQEKVESVYEALVLGIRDYMRKTGFSKALIGLSGGIDSALTCCLAVDAIGKENVLGISMPSPYSSVGSVEDSRKLAQNLGIEFRVIPISPVFDSYLGTLGGHFAGTKPDITEENLQARTRGNILMAFSNKFGHLLLSTGNKSEMAVGYCTLYGDMSGGLSVLADVPKTLVYELSKYINRESEIIPCAIIEKAPSAELRPDQLDQDTLPPYPVLDQVLNYYIEENKSINEIIALGFDKEVVNWVTRTVDRNEYKRKQAAPGLKVTSKAFGVGRRMPIAAKYKS